MWSRWITVSSGVLLASRIANAECVIGGTKPTVPLPTMEIGQEFSFIASGCERLRFEAGTLSKIPKAGPDRGSKDATYKVVLTEREWNALIAEQTGGTLEWSIRGWWTMGVRTYDVVVTTMNELRFDDQVAMSLSRADAKLVGEMANNAAGGSVSGAGDVNADGHDDLIIGAPGDNEGGLFGAGAAYLVLGPVTGTLDLSSATAKLVGERGYDAAGDSVSGAGDVDADGHDDVLVGAHRHPYLTAVGAAYLVLGPVTGTLDLSLADAKLVGEGPSDFAGYSVAGAGDVDGDGHDDVLFSATADDDGGGNAGAAYLFLGPVTDTLDVSMADAELVGEEAGDQTGDSVSSAGDVDGDGHADLLVGSQRAREDAGVAYLVKGPVTGSVSLSAADAQLVGERVNEYAGVSVSGAGDVDGDGHDDLLIGAVGNDEGGPDAGAAYLVSGLVTGTLDLSLADAKLVGDARGDGAGFSVSGAGDVDGDGHHDVLIGAPFHAAGGIAYLVLGPVTGTLELSLSDAKFVGEETDDLAGVSVSGAGDVDGDGRDDVLVGAQCNNEGTRPPAHICAGAAYLLYGGGL
jgi:hypothetical protein